MVEQLHEPNVYRIKPVNGVSTEWTVNHRLLQDLHKAHNNSDNTSDEEMVNVPYYNPKGKLKETPHTNKYATQVNGNGNGP